jgi:hypothetical protein
MRGKPRRPIRFHSRRVFDVDHHRPHPGAAGDLVAGRGIKDAEVEDNLSLSAGWSGISSVGAAGVRRFGGSTQARQMATKQSQEAHYRML